ncbi:MAG: hypothetical protein P4L71_06410 [Acetobacteraceae bacterium]|nr:hypothetical protein [Acetobacteraceae bacterium]
MADADATGIFHTHFPTFRINTMRLAPIIRAASLSHLCAIENAGFSEKLDRWRHTMKKTLLVAATLLTFGVGSAFAEEVDVTAAPTQTTQSAPAKPATAQNRVFSARTDHQTWVYTAFGYAGVGQGSR